MVVLLGPVAAGKGTQAATAAGEHGLLHLSTGDLFRRAIQAGTPLGEIAQGYMRRGELVPDEITVAMVREALTGPDAQAGVVFDGFPRTLAQAEALDQLLARLGSPLQRCVHLVVDEEALVQRLARRSGIEGRSDDDETTVRNRMRVYREQTRPLVDSYAGSGLLREVDGLGSVDEVADRVAEALRA
jgi:adenylate kinase